MLNIEDLCLTLSLLFCLLSLTSTDLFSALFNTELLKVRAL